MKKYLCLALLFCSYSHAHEPYVAPLSYLTANTQIPVIAGYAEEALNAEHALKQTTLTVIQPDQSQLQVQPASTLKSATVFDLALPQSGTYQLGTKVSFPLKYVQHNKEWKMLFDVAADKAGNISERDYVVPSDFKKAPVPVSIQREWSIQSYISKDKSSAFQNKTDAVIQVEFKTHPNDITAQQPVQILIKKSGQALKNAELLIRAQGQTDKQALKVPVATDGSATLTFPYSGQYLVEVSEPFNSTAKPVNQNYTIISLGVLPAGK
ncbi:DUF4198 domain-containing protein [Acinetobacter bereziniae]|uniref:DUF4198 domain-containing protein n=1 Tax=Acinetobacter TaxID=469 RepID=UPI000EF744D4|nr:MULTISPECIES: DUF4198 domain-containing protein [Acinetobacter]MBJ8420578.1 DUF4198 domain-containing protein [Acinetobacter bereziniae]MBJ9949139.1 DUF4198 domain-containing protein [Acinetobacter bereziniae]MCU4473218.1 DUF4198 domain-containing protein [Acinetobacter bereziniae]MCU4540592.1 DUF4198 domain-containing protein [Acinetobacter bereziniae]MCU4625278.1 DUF4198 domain-containing protein [Acinetobacter bereziniae]